MFEEVLRSVQRTRKKSILACSCTHCLLSRKWISWGLSAPLVRICNLALPHWM